MLDKNDQVEARLAKLDKLRQLGVNPYPHHFQVDFDSKKLQDEREELLAKETPVTWAGRCVRYNRKGKMCFMHLKDRVGRLQVVVFASNVSEVEYEVVKMLDIGDWVGVAGFAMVTQAGEFSIKVTHIELLSKAVRPLPTPKEKTDEQGNKVVFDEFTNVELRYRQRYVDLTLNDEVREVFYKRSRIIQAVREYLLQNNYLEVETPTLQPIYGGANARPFKTHHNAQGMELFLRVANELYLKRCIVGGLDRVFEFTHNFRNEGMDRTHSPEFSALEFYEAFADYNDMMRHFENIWECACIAANGTTEIESQGKQVSFKTPWPRLTVYQAIEKFGGLKVEEMSDDQIKAEQAKLHLELKGEWSRGRAILELFETICEPNLNGPIFITDFPKESTPLCKAHRTNPDLVEQFEPYVVGWEVGNAYTELNDPVVQRALLEEQVARGRGGEDETHPMDENFLHAIECGLPPTGGVGIGIDRMIMILTNQPTIRDVQLFPLMKPE